jgi:hypothetical protein
MTMPTYTHRTRGSRPCYRPPLADIMIRIKATPGISSEVWWPSAPMSMPPLRPLYRGMGSLGTVAVMPLNVEGPNFPRDGLAREVSPIRIQLVRRAAHHRLSTSPVKVAPSTLVIMSSMHPNSDRA